MGLLDFIFGNDEDDLENTEPKHPLESVPGFQRPMGSTTKDPQVGEDDAGNPVFRTMMGTTYTVRVNPDQRTIREKVVDAAPQVADAVKSYVQNPTLPTTEQVVDFAKDAAVGTVNQIDDVMSGRGTVGDVFGMVGGVGAAPRAINKLVDIAPEGESGTVLGLFLPAVKNSKYEARVKKANELKDQGASRDDIWNQTGLWQLAEKGDWLTEIDDSKAEIALTAQFNKTKPPKRFTTQTTKETRAVQGGGLSQEERLTAKIRTRKVMLDIRAMLSRGDIDEQTAKDLAREAQQKLDATLGSDKPTEFETVEVTKKVEIPRKKLTKGRSPATQKKSTLDEVLLHDTFFDEMAEMGIDVTNTSAEAGRRKGKASGILRSPEPYEYVDKSRVSAFKNAANWKYSPRNEADQELVRQWKLGNIPEEQVDAEMILSTMLHEVQHLIDTETFSTSGTGFNTARAKYMKLNFQTEANKQMKFLFNTKHSKETRKALALLIELKDETIDVSDITGGTLLGASQSGVRHSLDEIISDVYGTSKLPDTVETGKINLQPGEIMEIGKLFDEWNVYKTIMSNFPPDNPSHLSAKHDAKFDFVKRVSGTKPEGELGYEYANKTSNFALKLKGDSETNARARANALFHLFDNGVFNDIMADFYKEMKSAHRRNMNANPSDVYKREGGETKSRLVQARRDMTEKERKETPPYAMLDVDEELVWFADANGKYAPLDKD